jgi:CPA2 family monovalent cation:H+ antiporter-2
MASAHDVTEYKDVLVFLATAGVIAPIFNRFKISPILGFLIAGVALGPQGLGQLSGQAPWISWITFDRADELAPIGELGVVFLLFMIGIELSWERLRTMRRMVFGLGLSQVVACAALLGGMAWAFGQPPVSAIVLGAALSLSSTALVIPILAERKKLKTGVGRTAFAVLLAQDLAVAPILVGVSLLAGAKTGGGGWTAALLMLVPAAIAIVALVVAGRFLLRPVFHSAARAKSPEVFVAASLLIVLGAATAAAAGGLSMALGAFLAGLLLAETEFRREVEVVIDPFKGLLLGMFFVSVGAGLDLSRVMSSPLTLIAVTLGVIGLKAGATFVLARLFRVPRRTSVEAALVLGPAGEFAFVVAAQAAASGLISADAGELVLVSTTLGLFLIPALSWAAERLARQVPASEAPAVLPPSGVETPAGERVLVVGYGRVGKLVGEMLSVHDIDFVAVDSDPRLVETVRDSGQAIYFGDAGREVFLKACGIETARAVVVTMDAPLKVDEVVRAARALRPNLTLVARARDARHAAKLYKLGVTDAVPETVEASLQLAENTLIDLGVPMGLVIASVHEKRDEFRRLFREAAPDDRPTRGMRHTGRVSELF